MRIGAYYFPTDYGIEPGELARALEDRGFEALYMCEHTHIPVSRRTRFPGGGELPQCYIHTHDPFVALSFAAATTSKIRLGTGICLIAQRAPIATAKVIASLDMLSGGRFSFGIGGGWNVDEMENHGTQYDQRFKIVKERVLAMKQLWTQKEAEFHGDFVDFDPAWSYPKPVQTPHPPVLLGGHTDYTLKRVVDYCDGWLPFGFNFDPKAERERLAKFAEPAGRDPASISITLFGLPPDPAKIAQNREGGTDEVLLAVPDKNRDEILKHLDELAPLLG